jgi:hypothetical protein
MCIHVLLNLGRTQPQKRDAWLAAKNQCSNAARNRQCVQKATVALEFRDLLYAAVASIKPKLH